MSRPPASVLSMLCVALCSGALAAGIEGTYTFGPKGEATIRVAKGKEEGTFVGVLVRAEAKRLSEKLNQPVLDLKRVADGGFRGRLNAYHMRLSDDQAKWLDVPKAELLPSGDLRCTLRDALGGSAQVLYRRVQGAGPRQGAGGPPAAQPGQLAGSWQDPHGAVTHYVSHKRRYVGQLDKLSPQLRSQGFRVGDERVRVERTAPGVYRGTMRLRSYGGKHERWESVEITVKGDRLELVLAAKGKRRPARHTAVRLGSGGAPVAPPPATDDDGDLVGLWRDSHGGVTRFSREADSTYAATIVRLSSRNEGYGFKIGEVGIRVRRTGRYTYEGKVLAKTRGGRSQWWEAIEVAVLEGSLKYIRHMRSGGTERSSAVRIEE